MLAALPVMKIAVPFLCNVDFGEHGREEMKLEPFKMERMQSQWENVVRYNLSESGVHPIRINELLSEEEQARLLEYPMAYSQSNGTPELRRNIALQYPGTGVDNVLVTTGSSEANFLALWHLLEKGDEVVMMLPNYMQMHGLIRAFGAKVMPFRLREREGWSTREEEVKNAFSRRTKAVAVCNPNNPTGAVLSTQEMKLIADLSDDHGCWLLSDEVYQGAEREGHTTPSFWGMHDKVLITNGLSKANGLPGLRIGWLVGPERTITKLWSYHDYTTIGPSYVSDRIATIAMEPRKREWILSRTRSILRTNFPLMDGWVKAHGDVFSYRPPIAGAICYLRYDLKVNSTKLAERLIREKSVLIVPGDHFGMDHFVRIGYGSEKDHLLNGLDLIHELLTDFSKEGRR